MFFSRIGNLRGIFTAAIVAAIASGVPAFASEGLSQATLSKLSDPDRIVEALRANDSARVPIIVEFAMPSLPDASNFADAAAADAAQVSTIHRIQDQILGRAFAAQGGLDAALNAGELNLKRMNFSPMFAITVDSATLSRLASDPTVVRIHEDGIDRPHLNIGSPNSLERIQMPAAYAAGATGNGRHVAILDTGGRRTHKFLSSRIVAASCYGTNNAGQGSSSYCPGGAAESTTLDSANDCDSATIRGCGHGTHVAGTAAGFNSSLSSGEPAHGVARDARIISINVFSQFTVTACNNFGYTPFSNGCVLTWNSDQIKGLERVYALRNTYNIDAVNMSLGGGQESSHCDGDARKSIIDQLRGAGIATVISAGNNGFDTSVGAPACISTAIAVASSTKGDVRSGFSNWGNLIDVVAPGSDINASYTSGSSNSFFAQLSGTSMAAPHVTGAFAALRSVVPSKTVTEIENALKSTGTGITSAGVTKPRINVNSALTALGGAGTKAVMTSPAPGSTLAGASVTFQWSAGNNAEAYWLHVGSTVGGSQYHDSGALGTGVLSRNVTGLPTNGSTVRVRLWTRLAGAWQSNDYTYTAASAGTKAVMTSPAPGSTLAGASVTFQWSAGNSAEAYWLYVGSTVGGAQYHNSGQLGSGVLSRNVTGLPTDGSTVRVRLYTRLAGTWQFNDYTYTAASAGTKAVMTSPAPGSTLAGASVTFQWNAGSGAQAYWLYVGSTVGGAQYHNSGQLGSGVLSRNVTGLPTNGSTVRVRLFTRLSGTWEFNDYTYTAASTGAKAVMNSPGPGSTLVGSMVTFQWSAGSGAQAYWLYVGSTVGGNQYHDSGQLGTGTLSRTVSGLPTNGSTVRVRLYTRLSGVWQSNDYTYTAASGLASMSTPAPGTILPGASLTFQWTAGTGVTQYWLYVGTTGLGSFNILNAGTGSNTWRNVSGLPTSGNVFVRLWSLQGGVWRFIDYSYTGGGAGVAAMTSPAPGSTLPGTSVTFNWTAGTGVSQYWLYVGTSPGGLDILNADNGSSTSRTVSGLPSTGTVFVRLWSRQSSIWRYNDYVYTGASGGSGVGEIQQEASPTLTGL